MEFTPINKESKIYPGEYLLHSPSRQIVICGAFKKNENLIKVLGNGEISKVFVVFPSAEKVVFINTNITSILPPNNFFFVFIAKLPINYQSIYNYKSIIGVITSYFFFLFLFLLIPWKMTN